MLIGQDECGAFQLLVTDSYLQPDFCKHSAHFPLYFGPHGTHRPSGAIRDFVRPAIYGPRSYNSGQLNQLMRDHT